MQLADFIEKITQNIPVSFAETISVITEHYHYQPTTFSNGLGDGTLVNVAGTNEGSCKIFAFAMIHQLDEQTTLHLFGDFYHVDVLQNPDATGHQNIRNFMKFGWQGIAFEAAALQTKF